MMKTKCTKKRDEQVEPQIAYKVPLKVAAFASSSLEPQPHLHGTEASFLLNEVNDINSDYILWCLTHHGDPLTADDPKIYPKIASLLQVMSGISTPSFVTDLLHVTYQKATGTKLQKMKQEISVELLRKLEAMRRTQSNADRRDFAIKLGAVVSAVYKQFYEALRILPENNVRESIPNLPGRKSRAIVVPSIYPLTGTVDAPCSREIAGATETTVIPESLNARTDDEKSSSNRFSSISGKWLKKLSDAKVEPCIDIQFTLNGLASTGDPVASSKEVLYPVVSGALVVQEPTVDAGEFCSQGKGFRHASLKQLRRMGKRIHQAVYVMK